MAPESPIRASSIPIVLLLIAAKFLARIPTDHHVSCANKPCRTRTQGMHTGTHAKGTPTAPYAFTHGHGHGHEHGHAHAQSFLCLLDMEMARFV